MIGFVIAIGLIAVVIHWIGKILEEHQVLGITKESLCLLYYALVFVFITMGFFASANNTFPFGPYIVTLILLILHAPYFKRN